MSWFAIPKAFTAKTKAKAAEVNENFDAIETALNGLFQAGRVNGENLVLSGSEAGPKDIPGASVTLSLPLASLVLVNLEADIQIGHNGGAKHYARAFLNVDGSDKTPTAEIASAEFTATGPGIQATVGTSYALKLTAGSHTLKMRGSHGNFEASPPYSGALSATFWATTLGFTYLVIPDPEP